MFCNASLEACEARDTHGLYQRARNGEIANVTGIDAPYEEPKQPEIVLDTVQDSVETNVQKIIDYLTQKGLLKS